MQTHRRDLHGTRIALAMMSVVLSLGLLLNRIPALLAQDACPAALPTRLSVGTQGRVRSDGPNDLHAEPSLAASYAGEVQALGIFDIVAGPVCADDAVWWQVNFFGLIGWTQEGRDGVYWLNPHTATTPTPRPTVALTATPEGPGNFSAPTQTPVPELEATELLWTQPFDDPSTWAQTRSGLLPGEVKEGVYVMPTTAIQEDYPAESYTFVNAITSASSLTSYKISFDFQSQTPDLLSACGLIVVNAAADEELRVMFCRDSLSIMPAARDFDDSPNAVKTMESPVDAMDGGVHRISLVSDRQKLRLYVDGQGGLEFFYRIPLTSFLVAHIDTRLGVTTPQGEELASLDNLTVSLAPECLLIVTVTLKEVVVERLKYAVFTEAPWAVSVHYGIRYDANETREQTEYDAENEIGIWEVVYDAELVIGDRVTGFPPLTRTLRCVGRIKGGYSQIQEGESIKSNGNVAIYEGDLNNFPHEEIDIVGSGPSARNYRMTYTVEVTRVWGTPVDTASIDLSTVQVEYTQP